MEFDGIESLASYGFLGFMSFRELDDEKFTAVPKIRGVYVVLQPEIHSPFFLEQSRGGIRKDGKGGDPSVLVSTLEANWVSESPILYIGKAGGHGTKATLRSRLQAYGRFGSGGTSHRGGRYIWQLADADSLLVCWKELDDQEPAKVETELIAAFVKKFGRRPFANLKD